MQATAMQFQGQETNMQADACVILHHESDKPKQPDAGPCIMIPAINMRHALMIAAVINNDIEGLAAITAAA